MHGCDRRPAGPALLCRVRRQLLFVSSSSVPLDFFLDDFEPLGFDFFTYPGTVSIVRPSNFNRLKVFKSGLEDRPRFSGPDTFPNLYSFTGSG